PPPPPPRPDARRAPGAVIAHVHPEARTAFDRRRHVLAPDRGQDHVLDLLDGEPVAGELAPPQLEIHEVAAGHSLREDAPRARDVAKDRLEARPEGLD